MKKILVLFAHPRTDRSECNVVLADAARRVEAVTFVDLYAEYPTFEIDVDLEQKRLVEHDILVFQHPVYWYSSPAILKEWQDIVLEYGFAYGTEGRALEGMLFFNAVTAGGNREIYSPEGGYQCDLRDFFLPFDQSMRLCHMKTLPPFSLYSAGHSIDEGRLEKHAEDYERLLRALAEDRVDIDAAAGAANLSDDLDRWIGGAR